MIFTAGNILLIGSILLFVSIIVGKTGYRFGVPALLLFLVVGMLFGSDGLGLQFHNAKEAQFIGMVALSIILFSGGMDTKFTEIKPILTPGIVLSTAGVLLTALFTGLFIWWLSGMSWTNIHLPLITSLLLASTMSSTDSASVFAILRSQKMNLKHNLRPMYNPQNEKTVFPKRKRKVRSGKDQNESVQFPDTRTKIKQRLNALQMVFKRCFF